MTEQPDYSRLAGGAALGARLRRLSERIDRESARVYAAFGIDFEQRWFGILNQILLNGPMTVGDIATTLRVTHVSVSQSRRSLEARGFVKSLSDEKDARRRPIALTPRGQALTVELAALWQALGESAKELNAEAGDLIPLLNRLDDALSRQSLLDRALAHLQTSD
ncbi:MarR family winged helix-turn-helix transcriptional regulator [Sphingobium yanoikuyae]|uniref:MarR family transcriptional regulator n=1 Tax=Sphingobium yanoikuyae TaxID=13690 RepID=A0A291N0S1_SPHYA|nr:MarR family winged helix-turn-helix transcriptional regulator [Sphingobium yanoikuyae]ATI80805.1 MarR family transcriptional regulator [Sphingobium yanoikuyae]